MSKVVQEVFSQSRQLAEQLEMIQSGHAQTDSTYNRVTADSLFS